MVFVAGWIEKLSLHFGFKSGHLAHCVQLLLRSHQQTVSLVRPLAFVVAPHTFTSPSSTQKRTFGKINTLAQPVLKIQKMLS